MRRFVRLFLLHVKTTEGIKIKSGKWVVRAELFLKILWNQFYLTGMLNFYHAWKVKLLTFVTVCLIPKNLKDAGYMPLPLNEDGTWANWKTSKYFFVVDAGEIITLSCPNSTDAPNSFKIFPTKTEIKANCSKEDKFVVDAGMYKVSELQCNNKYYFTNNAERIRFWFASGSFSSYGLVCFYFFLFIFYYYL